MRDRGQDPRPHLGRWQTVSEEMFASVCMVCAKLAWVTLPRGEKRPRTGGSVLRKTV
jgi:hypothetical protein